MLGQRKLYRPVFFYRNTTKDEETIALVYRAARIRRVSLGEHFIISYQDEVFKTYLPRSAVRGSQALKRTSSLFFMREFDYDEMWDKFLDGIGSGEASGLWTTFTRVQFWPRC